MQNVPQLSKQFRPAHYMLQLELLRQERRFNGTIKIQGDLQAGGKTISLHAKELTINNATIDGQATITKSAENDELILTSETILSKGSHILELAFSGIITDSMHGLYPCYFALDGQDEELLATQFESHHAREVFPCIDEPAAKAAFDLTLVTEPGITVLSNTPVKTQSEENNSFKTTFETTPKMSTYLLAWVTGKLGYTEATTKDGVVIRAYATPDKVEKTRFALDVGVKSLELYNDYFNLPYPLPKCDMIALPDFSSGAMENWGCITYRESALLLDEKSSTAMKQRVAEVVAHELAHQWFGNLVTMQWWDDLWLNESFANWMATYVRDKLFPDWQMWTQFYNEEIAYALDRDSLKSVQKVQQPVQHPDEIRTLFDGAIVYAKGASLLHMAYHYIGEDAFREGLAAYMKAHAYGSTQAVDLWKAWSETSGKDIGAFMTPWISQSGHPMVTVKSTGNEVTLSQQRFFNNPRDFGSEETLWPVPLLAGDALSEELFTQKESTVTLKTTAPLALNQGRRGFYIPLYAPEHLALLANQVKAGQMDVVDRLGLLNEAYDLAKAGQQPTLRMLELLEAYKNEASEPVWGAISGAIGALKVLIDGDEILKPKIQKLTETLARQQYERLGWEHQQNESHFDELLRPTILSHMGYAERPDVVAKARELLQSANKPSDVLGDIRAVVFSINARLGDEATFEKLFAWVTTETSAELRVQLTAGICSVKDEARIKKLLGILKTKAVKPQDLFYWIAYLLRNRDSRPLMWQWIKDEWAWITEKFKGDMNYNDFARFPGSTFSNAQELAGYKQFFEPKQNDPMLKREIAQSIENIEARVLWRERDWAAVQMYLEKI